MVPLNNLLSAARCFSHVTVLKRSFTRGQLAGKQSRHVNCNQLPKEEFGCKPKPLEVMELPLPPKKALPCRKLDPCAEIRPKPKKKRYPWEHLMEVGVTFGLLLGLSYLFYRKWQKDIEEVTEELEALKKQLEELQSRDEEDPGKKTGKLVPPTWVQYKGGEMPKNAVIGGFHNEDLYVARAKHGKDLIPGKVLKSQATCYVGLGGLEFGEKEYELLTGGNLKWVPVKDKKLPPNGVEGGYTESGETYYIGRAPKNGVMTIGKIIPSQPFHVYIPFEGKEYTITEFEMLVMEEE